MGATTSVAAPSSCLQQLFAVAVAASPSSRTLPAEPEPRTRSNSTKRGSEGERSESLKRQKTETELDLAIRRNRETLIDVGVTAKQQDSMWKSLKGVQLLNKQKMMLEKNSTIPNGGKKSGPR